MKKMLQSPLLLALAALLLSACEKADPVTDEPAAQTGVVSGTVTDAQGNSLAGIKVVIEHTVWAGTYVYTTTNSTGNYAAELPAEPEGSWTAKAQIKRSAYGKEYAFDLAADNAAAFTRNGSIMRNFTWKLSGEKWGGGYYGAHVDVYLWGTDVPMNEVKLVFTPYDALATLIDGSPIPSFERTVEDVAGTFMVKDIPVGKYNIKAVYPGKTLLLQNRHLDEQPGMSKPVVFGKNGYLGETEYNIEFWLSE